MTRGPSQATYLQTGDGTPFLTLRDLPAGTPSGRAVLIVPPFGWDEVASYRPRRAWAHHLADRGADVLRIDLPGTGDSAGGPGDDDLAARWVEAVGVAARALTGRVTIVGIGLGGLLAWAAVSAGAPADDLVLWGAPGRGRDYTRELKAFARLERSKLQELNPGRELPPEAPGVLTAAGHSLAAATNEGLGTLAAADLPFPDGVRPRVLLLARDGVGPDARLAEAAAQAASEVATDEGHGWSELVAPPQESALCPAPVAAVDAWLDAVPATPTTTSDAPLGAPAMARDGEYAERPVRVRTGPDGDVEGILTEPPGGTAPSALLVLLNSGAIRRIGPNRMWVELARRWAARGVASLRLDLPGIGEAAGDDDLRADAAFYRPLYVEASRQALSELGPDYAQLPVASMGLCSGAWWSIELADQDPRVQAAIALNARALVWDTDLHVDRDARKVSYLLKASTYKRVLRGDLPLSRGVEIAQALLRKAVEKVKGLLGRGAKGDATGAAPTAADPTDALFDRLRDDGKITTLLFTGNEPVLDELRRAGRAEQPSDRWPALHLGLVTAIGDVHTLHPVAVQRAAHDHLDEAIARDLRLSSPAARS